MFRRGCLRYTGLVLSAGIKQLIQIGSGQHLRIRGTEGIVFHFVPGDPFHVGMFLLDQTAGLDPGGEEMQAEAFFRKGDGIKGMQISNGDTQFFLAFPDQTLLQAFTWFDLAAGEFPEQAAALVGGALTDENSVVVSKNCCCNLYHAPILSRSLDLCCTNSDKLLSWLYEQQGITQTIRGIQLSAVGRYAGLQICG